MIDSYFIVRYTNALYSTSKEFLPRYDEFRDMFSSGQIASKEWAVKELLKLNLVLDQNIIIVGAWFGTLGLMLKKQFPLIKLTLLDIDPRCGKFLDNIIYNMEDVFAVTKDMFEYNYTQDIVVNTACEHIHDIRKWLDQLKEGTIVLLQSNNFFSSPDHVSCISSEEEFKEQVKLKEILYSGKLETPMYTRFMIIGKV